jgi:hemerythrin
MKKLKWLPELETGIIEIDVQHKNLMNTVNILDHAIHYNKHEDVLKKIIDALISYSKRHFADEEKLFKEIGFEDEEHINKHKYFIEKIKEFNSLKLDKETSYKILDFINDWFSNHVLIMDKKYVDFVKSKKT